MSAVALDNLNDRVWYAWHCLPRSKQGKPPSWRSLEVEHGLPLAVFSKLSSGERGTVDATTLGNLSIALRVTTDWLEKGAGEPPALTGPITPRAEKYAAYDPSQWVKQAEAAEQRGEQAAPSTLEVAIHRQGKTIDPDVVARIRERFRGRESGLDELVYATALLNEQLAKKRKLEAAKRTREKADPPATVAPAAKEETRRGRRVG